jgi:hypothetical protein
MRLSFSTNRDKRLSREDINKRSKYNNITHGSKRSSFQVESKKSNAKKEKEMDSARLIELVKESQSTSQTPITFYFNRKVSQGSTIDNTNSENQLDESTNSSKYGRDSFTNMLNQQSSTQKVSFCFFFQFSNANIE